MNLNPPSLGRIFSATPVTIATTGYGQTIAYTYFPFSIMVVLNGRILGEEDCSTSSGSGLVFSSELLLTPKDTLRIISVEALTTLLTTDSSPIGSIMAYGGNTLPPAGYMWLRKTKLNKITYSALYSVIGDSFNDGTQSTAEFMLPDADGRFLRAFDSTGLVDPSRVFGSKQADAIKNHNHGDLALVDNTNSVSGISGVSNAVASSSAWGKVYGTNATAGKAYTTANADGFTGTGVGGLQSGNVIGGSAVAETRPANLALNFIIKVTDGYKNQALIDVAGLTSAVATLQGVPLIPNPGIGPSARMRNIVIAGATSAGFRDDAVTLYTSGGVAYTIPSFFASMSVAGTSGLGGMDTTSGAVAANQWILVYAAYNPTTKAYGCFGTLDSSATAMSAGSNGGAYAQYQGSNLPAGYVATALIGVILTSATAGVLASTTQLGRKVRTGQFSMASGSTTPTSTTWTALTATVLPYCAISIDGIISMTSNYSSGAISLQAGIGPIASGAGYAPYLNSSATGPCSGNTLFTEVPIHTPRTLSYFVTNNVSTSAAVLWNFLFNGFQF